MRGNEMKVSKNNEKGFTPFTLNITIESEEEARAMYAIFSHTRNTRLLAGKDELITSAIGPSYSIQLSSDIIANRITYMEFY